MTCSGRPELGPAAWFNGFSPRAEGASSATVPPEGSRAASVVLRDFTGLISMTGRCDDHHVVRFGQWLLPVDQSGRVRVELRRPRVKETRPARPRRGLMSRVPHPLP